MKRALALSLIAAAVAAPEGAAALERAVVIRATSACASWAARRELTQASLRPQGAAARKDCALRLKKGARVTLVDSDEQGIAEVRIGKRTWFIDVDAIR